jgi:N-acetylglucosamine malate deacetylase 1
MKVDLLAIGAHPDDVEIGAAGTILKHRKTGKKISICDLTFAELSSNGDIKSRQQEAERAAKRLGLEERINLGIPDRQINITEDNIRKLVEVIRKCQPTVVISPYWEDRHPDHIHCSELAREAVFNAGIRKYGPELGDVHRVSKHYFYIINGQPEPDFCIDVTDVYDEKMEVLKSYESQFAAFTGSVKTPLNTGYFEMIRAREYLYAKKIHKGFAEGFKTQGPIELDYFGG